MTKIFIDDERWPPAGHDGDWLVLRSFNDVMNYFADVMTTSAVEDREGFFPETVSFDHDLGQDQPSGYDIAKKMVEMDMDGMLSFPDNFTWMIHSENPVGRDNINGLLRSYLEFRKNYYEEGESK